MKKVFIPYLLLCIIAAILLSSCGSSTSITKRRYMKGYHVSHSPAKHNTSTKHEKTTLAKAATPLLVAPKTENQATAAETKPASDLKSPAIAANAKKAPIKLKRNNTGTTASNQVVKNNPNLAEFLAKRSFKSINNSVVQKAPAHEDGLSLLWIVIVVLLVLFFLGLVGDVLGGLIYILLVVALILLILWLLRVL